ncbi:MAG: hypothetical protein AUI53_07525 [Acidobacteria bacterium 13_1_40CM_2_60_7]|nr:MAG: hypothetical protein AUI53_07525 [Acidobacteria bacterium 13_1_40CM_2_60_7]OLE84403.1 MAG: hypothetical protein AUG07_06525 [Acidobacteria bacterium 13_1_20CM_2_60_10]
MNNPLAKLWRRRKGTVPVFASLLAVGLIFGSVRLASHAPKIPTAVAERKEFVEYVQIRGEVKATRSVTIAAPYKAGDLQIVKLVPNGTKAKKGDVLVEFDATTMKQNLAQDQSALKSAEAEIQQARAAARLKEEQDLTDLMKARYDVDRARMDTGKQEILSPIEGAEAKLKLADAEQKLKETEAKLKADRASAVADIAAKKQKRDQAAYQVQQDQRSLDALTLRAPIDGMLSLLNHWQPQGGETPFKQGDRAWPGAGLAELPDPSTLKVVARIEEAERGRIQAGQSASVRMDAVPDRTFEAHVADISPIATLDFNGGWPFPRNFSMEINLGAADSRLSPGMTANVRVAVDRVADGLVIPARAVFRKAGRTVAYVRRGSKFEEAVIEVARRSGEEALVAQGLVRGQQVALQDPTISP